MNSLRPYLKPGAAVLATVLMTVYNVVSDNVVTTEEWVLIGIALSGAVQVAIVPNLPPGNGVRTYARFAVLAVQAVLAALVTSVSGGLSPQEIVNLVIIGLGAIGVMALPDSASPRASRAPL